MCPYAEGFWKHKILKKHILWGCWIWLQTTGEVRIYHVYIQFYPITVSCIMISSVSSWWDLVAKWHQWALPMVPPRWFHVSSSLTNQNRCLRPGSRSHYRCRKMCPLLILLGNDVCCCKQWDSCTDQVRKNNLALWPFWILVSQTLQSHGT